MEAWLIYALLTYFLWAVTNIVDKIFLNKHFKSPLVYNIFVGIFQLAACILIPFFGFATISINSIFLGLLVGVLFFLSTSLFFKALSSEDASVVVPLGSFIPLLVLIFSSFLLGDKLTQNEYIAFVLFLVGGFILSIKVAKKLYFTPALKWMLLSIFMFAITFTLTKVIFNTIPFFEGFILIRGGTFLIALILAINKRKLIKKQFKILSTKSKTLFAASNTLGIASQFFFNLAILLGAVALVNAAQGLQYVFLFIFALLISILFPKILKEDLHSEIVIRKIIGILLIVIALYVLNM